MHAKDLVNQTSTHILEIKGIFHAHFTIILYKCNGNARVMKLCHTVYDMQLKFNAIMHVSYASRHQHANCTLLRLIIYIMNN